MKNAFKALWHGVKKIVTTVIEWLCKLFGISPEQTQKKCFHFLRFIVGMVLTIIIVFWVAVAVMRIGENIYWWIDDMVETDEELFSNSNVSELFSDNLYFYEKSYSSGGFIADSDENILLKDVVWIAKPAEGDSLVCYSDGSKRGYFHMRDGHVVVMPEYNHAWVFSEGLAAVEDRGYVKFIDKEGHIVIDRSFVYDEEDNGYVFHQGHCAVNDKDGKHMGLIDRNGEWVLPPLYDVIAQVDTFWIVGKEECQCILTFGMDTVIPMTKARFSIEGTNIKATFHDHTLGVYSLDGKIVAASQIGGVEQMYYNTRIVMYHCRRGYDGYVEEEFLDEEPDTRKEIATCRKYEAECGWYGLMSPSGKMLTPPSYIDIEAVGRDQYLCKTNYGRGVLLNSKGQRIE